MAKNKLPVELHLVHGTKGMNPGKLLPDDVKTRIPKAYWLENPDLWDEDKFIADTSDFLYKVYGIGADQYQHTLAMLADHITTYVKCRKGLQKSSLRRAAIKSRRRLSPTRSFAEALLGS